MLSRRIKINVIKGKTLILSEMDDLYYISLKKGYCIMEKEKLIRTLNSVGKECFITYFDHFINLSIPNYEIVKKLFSETKYTKNSCVTRTSKARSIVKKGMVKDALYVVSSAKVPVHIAQKAGELLFERARRP